jgi:hypothetical protein
MKKWQLWLVYVGYFGLISWANWQWQWVLIYWILGGALGVSFEYWLSLANQKYLSSNSALFMIGWLILAIYVITSTGSAIAMGLVMGIGLRFLLDIVINWNRKDEWPEKYFWQIKRHLSLTEMKVTLGIIALGFGWLTIVMVNL